jgi:creatinine amidohydrolase
MLTDVCESMVRHGARRIVIVNWHELNEPLIALVAGQLQQKHPVRFVLVQAHYVALDLYGQEAGLTHGGLLEALPVLAYNPALAKLERGTDPSPREQGSKMDKLRRRREAYTVVHDVREMYPTGWYGTLQGATEERAKEFVEGVTARIVEYVTEALEALQLVASEASQ